MTAAPFPPCPACGSEDTVPCFDGVADVVNGAPWQFDCSACGTRFAESAGERFVQERMEVG